MGKVIVCLFCFTCLFYPSRIDPYINFCANVALLYFYKVVQCATFKYSKQIRKLYFLVFSFGEKISADKLLKMEGNDPSKNIKDWLAKMGDPNWDPWPKNCFGKEILDDENGIKIDPTIHDENYKYRGHRDEDGEPHAFGEITYENGDIVQSEFKHGEIF